MRQFKQFMIKVLVACAGLLLFVGLLKGLNVVETAEKLPEMSIAQMLDSVSLPKLLALVVLIWFVSGSYKFGSQKPKRKKKPNYKSA